MRRFPAWVLLALAACSQSEVPQDRFYRIVAQPPAAPLAAPVVEAALEVERPDADGLTAGRPIVYADRARPNQLYTYNYHFWAEPPAIMLRDQLVACLRAAGVAREVVTEDLRVGAGLSVVGKVRRLEQILGEAPTVVVEIELGVRDNARARMRHLATYAAEAAADDDGVAAAADAFNRAFTEVCTRFAADLGRI